MAPNYSKHSHCNGQDDCLYNHVFIIWSVPVEFIAINATSKPNELLMTLMFFTSHWNRNAINCLTGIKEQIRLLEMNWCVRRENDSHMNFSIGFFEDTSDTSLYF